MIPVETDAESLAGSCADRGPTCPFEEIILLLLLSLVVEVVVEVVLLLCHEYCFCCLRFICLLC